MRKPVDTQTKKQRISSKNKSLVEKKKDFIDSIKNVVINNHKIAISLQEFADIHNTPISKIKEKFKSLATEHNISIKEKNGFACFAQK